MHLHRRYTLYEFPLVLSDSTYEPVLKTTTFIRHHFSSEMALHLKLACFSKSSIDEEKLPTQLYPIIF